MKKYSNESLNDKLSEIINFMIFWVFFRFNNSKKCDLGHLIFTPHGTMKKRSICRLLRQTTIRVGQLRVVESIAYIPTVKSRELLT